MATATPPKTVKQLDLDHRRATARVKKAERAVEKERKACELVAVQLDRAKAKAAAKAKAD